MDIAPNLLTDRLNTLVTYGVMTKEPYQDPGSRPRHAYQLTEAGQELQLVLGALQQWGDEHLPCAYGPSVLRRTKNTDSPVHVAFVDVAGREVSLDEVDVIHRVFI